MADFGSRLKEAMEKQKINASELSRISGVGKNLISYYVNGKYNAKQDKVYMLANALHVDPGWLMTGKDLDSMSVEELLDPVYKEIELIPQTPEARIISGGIDKMSPERRKRALKLLQAAFEEFSDSDFNEEEP